MTGNDTSYPTIIMGHVHFIRRSYEWEDKAMEDIINLGSIWLTHKPNKMMSELRSSSRPLSSFKELIKRHPEMEKMYNIDWEREWVSSKPEYYGYLYEEDLWGDDWNDRPAYCNCGEPYGGERVDLEAGDFVIVIKNNCSPTKVKEEIE